MVKKTVFLASLLASTYTAPTMADSNFYRSGFFTGAHVGASFGSGTFNNALDFNFARVAPSLASQKARKTSPLFGVFGGYRHIFNEGYTIGLDVAANTLVDNEMRKTLIHKLRIPIPCVTKLSHPYSIVPSVNFGKIIGNRFHAYLGLGLAISRFKQSVVIMSADNLFFKASRTKVGFVLTVGVEYAITSHVSVLGTVSYAIYGKVRKNFYSDIETYTIAIKPQYLTLKVGAMYRF